MLRNRTVLVVDDEAPARELIFRQIERSCPSLSLVQTASHAKEAKRYIDTLSPDVVFVDIRLPNESGLDLIELYKNRDFYLEFATTYHECAVEALRQRAFDYLLKPIDKDELQVCRRRILMHFYKQGTSPHATKTPLPRRLEISTTGKRHFVKHDDILHIEACGSYSTVFLSSGRRITISMNLKRFEHMLDDPLFFRVNNSKLGNLNRIHQCNHRLHLVTLDNGKEIPLAVRQIEQLRHNMQQLMAS